MEKNESDSLFDLERAALSAAKKDISDPRHAKDALLPKYQILVDHYEKLLKLTRKIFYISDRQGVVVQRHRQEIQDLLDHANQGFLTFGADLTIDRQYSAECVRIFGKKIAGEDAAALLAAGDGALELKLRDILRRLASGDKETARLALGEFPGSFRICGKVVRSECKLIAKSGRKLSRRAVMLILTDITDQMETEKKIRLLSYSDKLTALYNRAFIEDQFTQMEQIDISPLSIIMADMNGLKLVNDVFGHWEGDMLLQAMAKVLKKVCRNTDMIARWGGDEFVVLLPNTEEAAGRKICERILAACAEVDDCAIPLSVALGMASIPKGRAADLADLFKMAESRMYSDKLDKRREIQKNILKNLEGKLVYQCFEDAGHRVRVSRLAVSFAIYLGHDADGKEVKTIKKLVKMHDLGKVAIPSEILGNRSMLTLSEWDILKSHSEIGYRMARSIGEQEIADIILALRERWDGRGYPFGLKGKQIPYLARLFAIVDTYDVITHDRLYKDALNEEMAAKEIEAGKHTQFDPELADAFLAFIAENNE